MDFTNTLTLLAAIEEVPKEATFLRDRYFPTNASTDIFNTDEVLVEYKDGDKKLAPFVSPRKNGVSVFREGYEIHKFEPANIAPKRPLYIDELKKKGFGEALFSTLTPEQRQTALLMKDYQDLDQMISRREEKMAAELLQTNGLVMKHIADKGDEYEEKSIQFYTGSSNPAVYTPSKSWADASADIYGDIAAMIAMLTKKGLPATDVLLGTDATAAFINNTQIQKFMDNRRFELGGISQSELPNGAAQLGTLVVNGHKMTFYGYDNTYTDDDGTDKPYLDAASVVVTAPACGRTAYGAVTQVEQADGEFHTYAGARVPHYVASAEGNSRSITITAKPLMMPNHKNAFIVGKVIL